MENGLTAQLMNNVTPMPRQCSLTWRSAPKSILTSIGMIMSQISTATGRLTSANSMAASIWKGVVKKWPRAIPATMQRATHSER